MSNGENVAQGKSASQSATLKHFVASRAVDGKSWSFSHTRGKNPWIEIDLKGLYPISSVEIANRWCRNPSDQKKCLCRLSDAKVSLIDGKGDAIVTKSIGDTCDELNILVDIDPIPCLYPTYASTPVSSIVQLLTAINCSSGRQLSLIKLLHVLLLGSSTIQGL